MSNMFDLDFKKYKNNKQPKKGVTTVVIDI